MTDAIVDTLPDANPSPAPEITPTVDAAAVADVVVDAKTTDTPAPVSADFPEDWRERMAGDITTEEGKKALGILKRYSSPKSYSDAYLSLRTKQSTGELKTALATGATPEQTAAWRAENGIPASPEDYYTQLKDGVKVSDADKPIIDKFLQSMHGANASPEIVNAAIDTYNQIQQESQAFMAESDKAFAAESEEVLRSEWGPDYRGNKTMISNLLDTAPSGLKERLLGGSLGDGRLIKDDPMAQRWLADLAREMNPAATIIPASGAGSVSSLETERSTLEAKMGTKSYTPQDRARHTEIEAMLGGAQKR